MVALEVTTLFAYRLVLIFVGCFVSEWTALVLSCCPASQRGPCDLVGNKNPMCVKQVQKMIRIIQAPDINRYNLYDKCLTAGASGLQADGRYRYYDIPYLFINYEPLQKERQNVYAAFGDKLKSAIPCVNVTSLETYMGRQDVRKAIHIPTYVQKFEVCSGVVIPRYTIIYRNTKQFYATVLSAKKRILVYNGDIDMACNFLGDEWFVQALGQKKLSPRRQWKYVDPETRTQQVAGFVDTYDHLTFTTIRGAGHMVPQDKPKVAYDMFMKFLNNQDF